MKNMRRILFKTALASLDITQIQWGKEHGIGNSNLCCILTGTRKSARVIREIDEFIEQQINSLKTRRNKAA